MAYVPNDPPLVIRDKISIPFVQDGQPGDEQVLNMHVDAVADMVITLRGDSIVTDPALKGQSSQTVEGPFYFNGRVYFNGGSSANDDAVAMAIALG